jgi:hypothetical protein
VSLQAPPRIATWLLAHLLPPQDREAVIGDLIEEYAVRARSTSRSSSAAAWYWRQTCRSLPLMLWAAATTPNALRTLGVAVGAYLAAGLLEFASTVAIAKLIRPDARVFTVLSVVVGLATIVLAGYVAASIRSGAARALAGVAALGVVLLMVNGSGNAPLWYALVFLLVGPSAALGGGALRRVVKR